MREAKGEASAQLIDHLKKSEMAKEAERLLAATGWLPEPLRTADAQVTEVDGQPEARVDPLPAFLADGEDDGRDDPTPSDPEEEISRTPSRRNRLARAGGCDCPHLPISEARPSRRAFFMSAS